MQFYTIYWRRNSFQESSFVRTFRRLSTVAWWPLKIVGNMLLYIVCKLVIIVIVTMMVCICLSSFDYFKPKSTFKWSLDYSTICRKRVTSKTSPTCGSGSSTSRPACSSHLTASVSTAAPSGSVRPLPYFLPGSICSSSCRGMLG